jgi:hypothetical protein
MARIPENWLQRLNEDFGRKGVAHFKRPILAMAAWAKEIGGNVYGGSEEAKQIDAWFDKRSPAGALFIPPVFEGLLYYDARFWLIRIPLGWGAFTLSPEAALGEMPEPIRRQLCSDQPAAADFEKVWSDCIDYGYGFRDLAIANLPAFAQSLLRSADKEVRPCVKILHGSPNSKALEVATLATEMFLKCYLAIYCGLDEHAAKQTYGHKLQILLDAVVCHDPSGEFSYLQGRLSCFPNINDRYHGTQHDGSALWRGYQVSQFVGAALMRKLAGQKSRKANEASSPPNV